MLSTGHEYHLVWPLGENMKTGFHAVTECHKREFGVAFSHLFIGGVGFHELQVDGHLRVFPLEPSEPVRQMVQADMVARDNLKLTLHLPGVRRQRNPGIVDFIQYSTRMRQ